MSWRNISYNRTSSCRCHPEPNTVQEAKASNKNKLCAPKYITVAAKNNESEINNIFFLPKSSSHFPVNGLHKTEEIRNTAATKPFPQVFF